MCPLATFFHPVHPIQDAGGSLVEGVFTNGLFSCPVVPYQTKHTQARQPVCVVTQTVG